MSNIAVIMTGGKQYLVKPGDVLRVEKLAAKEGEKLSFDALLVADEAGTNAKVGTPAVAGCKVEAQVTGHGRAKKVIVVKFKCKVRYKRKAGHRQEFTALKIAEVKA
jgi:large subunit ribosomal protein L21